MNVVTLLSSKKLSRLLVIITVCLVGFLLWFTYDSFTTKSTSTSLIEQQKVLYDKNPILGHIPYRTPFYSISYDTTKDNSLIIKIYTPSPYYRWKALEYLEKKDQESIMKYEIKFIDYKSPLNDKGGING